MIEQVTGTIEGISKTKSFDSGFTTRLLLVTTGGEYPQKIPIEFHKDRTSLLDGFNKGQYVTVNVNLRGNEWTPEGGTTKYFVKLVGWKIAEANSAEQATPPPAATPPPQPVPANTATQDQEDDLPF